MSNFFDEPVQEYTSLFREEWNGEDEVTLYKGNRFWTAKRNGVQVTVTTGTEGGASKSTTREFKGSSVGRSNEKSPEFNAKKWIVDTVEDRIKLDGFTMRKGEAHQMVLLPMLASSYEKEQLQAKLTPKVFLQPKLDGVRMLINTKSGKIYSRQGKELYASHISEAVLDAKITEVEWIDGEGYSHNVGFQTIVGLVKRLERGPEDRQAKLGFQFHNYDCIMGAPFKHRYEILKHIHAGLKKSGHLRLVETHYIDKDEINGFHSRFVKQKYEGSIIRLDNAVGYETNKRSKSLIKNKDFLDAEFKIIGFQKEEGDINKPETLGAVLLVTEEGKEFSARPAMTQEERKHIWDNRDKYMGKLAVVKYQELTTGENGGVPRFPNVTQIRDQVY